PCADGETDLLTYFTDEASYGAGFTAMRAEMRRCVEASRGGEGAPAGSLALTAAYLRDMKPAQSILAGTSSFRLDMVSTYLSDRGPDWYFTRGLGVTYSQDEARRLANDVLEEVLGVYAPPASPYRGQARYVCNALAEPANRRAADAAYLACLMEIG